MMWLPTNPEPPVTSTVLLIETSRFLPSARFARDASRLATTMSTDVYYGSRLYVYSRRLMKKKTLPTRRRDAAATRAAILNSARQAFARAGYEGVGVREIAEGAGVTAMLVNRYFGSKEQLFAEVVADIIARAMILTQSTLQSPTAGNEIAAALVGLTTAGGAPLDGFNILLYSASSPRAAEIGR